MKFKLCLLSSYADKERKKFFEKLGFRLYKYDDDFDIKIKRKPRPTIELKSTSDFESLLKSAQAVKYQLIFSGENGVNYITICNDTIYQYR